MARLGAGELEAAVMGVLWSGAGWRTPGEVHEVLSTDRAMSYGTVATILVRLWRKGRLERKRDGRAFAYRPRQTCEEYVAAKMSEDLQRAVNRSAALSDFVRMLSRAERVRLRRVLS